MLKLFIDGGFGTAAFGRCGASPRAPTGNRRWPSTCSVGRYDLPPVAIDVLQIEDGIVTEIITFGPGVSGFRAPAHDGLGGWRSRMALMAVILEQLEPAV